MISVLEEQGDLTAAQQLTTQLQDMPLLANFCAMQNIIINLQQDSLTPYAMRNDSLLRAQVESIAADTTIVGFEIARAMLAMVFGYKYPVWIDPLPPANSSRISLNSTDDIAKGALSIYPNPANRSTVIEALMPDDAEKGQIIVYNFLGKRIEMFLLHKGKNVITFNVGNLSPGVYFCVMNDDTGIIDKQKIVILSSH